ncbi:tyrosine-protein phosphatase [Microbulbifer sp. MCCC 1A16149]|uniref:tyrosine-protein phosphatase n=1 Tax=Microbulbifer sp. MCCC 1A16149 TaxID=3411322 RepID=UPI003D0999BA
MIDLHCHILPGLDDGPRDLRGALALAQAAFSDGITHCVATPHIHPGRYPNSLGIILGVYEKFRAALESEGVPLKLGVAAEIRLSENILEMVSRERVPYLGEWFGYKVILLELPYSHIPAGTDKLIRWLLKRRIRPMIAHPERNKDVIRDFGKIMPLALEGCLFQVTAGSLLGHFGETTQRCAIRFLERELVTVLATDAHHELRRPPTLTLGRKAAENVVGEQNAWKLVLGNPGKIAASQFSRTANAAPCTLLPNA